MPPPLAICHVITTTRTGGAETQLLRLIEATAGEAGHRVICLEPRGELAGAMERAGARVESLGLASGPAALIKGPAALARLLRECQPHIIQTWMYHADLMGILARPLYRRAPLIWTLRCSDLDLAAHARSTRLTVAALTKLSPLPWAVLANSRSGLEWHRRLGYRNKRLEIIPNGFACPEGPPDPEVRTAARRELGIAGDVFLVGHVARLDPAKDHPGFFRAAARAAGENPNLHFLLIGQGLEPANPALPWPDGAEKSRFHLLGRREDVPLWLAAMDLFVQSSRSEGLPNALGEALAAGVPSLATEVGDSRELMGGTGRLVPPGDPEALARGMLEMAGLSSDERREMGRRSREHMARNYSLAAMARTYLDLYRRAVEPFRPGR